jgi:hypothetical protein
MKRLKLAITLTLLTPILANCAVQIPLSANSACTVWRGISWSPKDTDETIRGVKENNARHQAYCKGDK